MLLDAGHSKFTVTLYTDSLSSGCTELRRPGTLSLLEPMGYVPPAESEARYYEQAAVA